MKLLLILALFIVPTFAQAQEPTCSILRREVTNASFNEWQEGLRLGRRLPPGQNASTPPDPRYEAYCRITCHAPTDRRVFAEGCVKTDDGFYVRGLIQGNERIMQRRQAAPKAYELMAADPLCSRALERAQMNFKERLRQNAQIRQNPKDVAVLKQAQTDCVRHEIPMPKSDGIPNPNW